MTLANLAEPDAATNRLRAGWSRLRAQVERMTRRTDGEDLLHDAYVSMAGLATAPRNDEAFLVHAAVNRGRDAFRREAVRGPCEPVEAIDWLRDPAPIQDEVMIAKARLARVREGIDRLTAAIAELLGIDDRLCGFVLDGSDGAAFAWLYEHGDVVERSDAADGTTAVTVRMSETDAARFEKRFAGSIRRPSH